MNDQLKFFLFLIERYATYKDKPTGVILKEWDDHGITQEIFDSYLEYGEGRIENVFTDIDMLLTADTHAW